MIKEIIFKLLAGILFITLIIFGVIRLNSKKYGKVNSPHSDQKPIIPKTKQSESATEHLEQEYIQSCSELEQVKQNKIYSSLFENITPAMQQLQGYDRYKLETALPKEIKNKLIVIAGPNLDNAILNAGFQLTQKGSFEYKRAKSSMQFRPADGKNADELKLMIEKNRKEAKVFQTYNLQKAICEKTALSLASLKSMIDSGSIDPNEIHKMIAGIRRAYEVNGLEFKFYEDFYSSCEDGMGFLKGDQWSVDYPAVYKDGQVYCNFVGRRNREE